MQHSGVPRLQDVLISCPVEVTFHCGAEFRESVFPMISEFEVVLLGMGSAFFDQVAQVPQSAKGRGRGIDHGRGGHQGDLIPKFVGISVPECLHGLTGPLLNGSAAGARCERRKFLVWASAAR